MNSTKLLRPLQYTPDPSRASHDVVTCRTCGINMSEYEACKAGWYRDAGAPQDHYCPAHTLLEDLDPDWLPNDRVLEGLPVSRKMPLQGITDLAQIFSKPIAYRAPREAEEARRNGRFWVHLPTGSGFCPYPYVIPTEAVLPVLDQMVYGRHGDYYFDIIWRHSDTALVSLKYQQILGQRFVCLVPRQAVLDFFPMEPTA